MHAGTQRGLRLPPPVQPDAAPARSGVPQGHGLAQRARPRKCPGPQPPGLLAGPGRSGPGTPVPHNGRGQPGGVRPACRRGAARGRGHPAAPAVQFRRGPPGGGWRNGDHAGRRHPGLGRVGGGRPRVASDCGLRRPYTGRQPLGSGVGRQAGGVAPRRIAGSRPCGSPIRRGTMHLRHPRQRRGRPLPYPLGGQGADRLR